jgi:hypothetical protein
VACSKVLPTRTCGGSVGQPQARLEPLAALPAPLAWRVCIDGPSHASRQHLAPSIPHFPSSLMPRRVRREDNNVRVMAITTWTLSNSRPGGCAVRILRWTSGLRRRRRRHFPLGKAQGMPRFLEVSSALRCPACPLVISTTFPTSQADHAGQCELAWAV